MGTKEQLSHEEQLRREANIAQGKLLLSAVRENADQGDVSECVVGLMEHLTNTNLELSDVGSSVDDIVVHLHLGINTAIAETLCEIAQAMKLGEPVGTLMRYAYDLTQGLKNANDWLGRLMGRLDANRHAERNEKLITDMLEGGLDPEKAALEFRDPFAALHDAAQNPMLDAELVKMGYIAPKKAGESALARLIDLERTEGANPLASRSTHDVGFFHLREDDDDVIDLKDDEIQVVDDADSSVVRALTQRPPELPSPQQQQASS